MKSVLITGGTGSIGLELAKSLAENEQYSRVVIYSRDWHKQKAAEKLLSNYKFRYFLGDIRDAERIKLAAKGVTEIIHTAALKDVEFAESNPVEAMSINVIGTKNVLDAALYNNVRRTILISTDKAVNPINTYGATKAVAERLTLNYNTYAAANNIKFAVCRFGNVVDSAGGVLLEWLKDDNIKLDLYHPDATRFWLTKKTAVKFIFDTQIRMVGDSWDYGPFTFLYTPDMRAFRIKDLIEIVGKPYKITSLNWYEKLHEYITPYNASCDADMMSIDDIIAALLKDTNIILPNIIQSTDTFDNQANTVFEIEGSL